MLEAVDAKVPEVLETVVECTEFQLLPENVGAEVPELLATVKAEVPVLLAEPAARAGARGQRLPPVQTQGGSAPPGRRPAAAA